MYSYSQGVVTYGGGGDGSSIGPVQQAQHTPGGGGAPQQAQAWHTLGPASFAI